MRWLIWLRWWGPTQSRINRPLNRGAKVTIQARTLAHSDPTIRLTRYMTFFSPCRARQTQTINVETASAYGHGVRCNAIAARQG